MGPKRGDCNRSPHSTGHDAKEPPKPELFEILTALTARRNPLPSKVTNQ